MTCLSLPPLLQVPGRLRRQPYANPQDDHVFSVLNRVRVLPLLRPVLWMVQVISLLLSSRLPPLQVRERLRRRPYANPRDDRVFSVLRPVPEPPLLRPVLWVLPATSRQLLSQARERLRRRPCANPRDDHVFSVLRPVLPTSAWQAFSMMKSLPVLRTSQE